MFVDRILKGAKPSELHIEGPTKCATAVNPKTPGALGIAVPDALLLRADEIIRQAVPQIAVRVRAEVPSR